MSALLDLLSPREWLFAAIAVAALFVAWRIYSAGEARIELADARVAAAQQVHNQEVEDAAAGKVAQALADFKASELQPVVVPAPLTRLVCIAPRGGPVPGAGGAPSGSNGGTAISGEGGITFDPATALIADGRDADSQVKLLQDLIRSYQAAGVVAR